MSLNKFSNSSLIKKVDGYIRKQCQWVGAETLSYIPEAYVYADKKIMHRCVN